MQPQEHDIYQWSDGLIACRRCGKQWQAKNGDFVGWVDKETEESGIECPDQDSRGGENATTTVRPPRRSVREPASGTRIDGCREGS